jgi:hypothetical protein
MSGALMRDLKAIHEKRKAKMRLLYDAILKDCTGKMRVAAAQKNLRIVYELPLVYRGLPPYDLGACKRYVSKVLTSQEFMCSDAGGRFLLISWKEAIKKAPGPPKAPVARKVEPSKPPPLPPIMGKDDLFAIPSFDRLKHTARSLKQ